MKFALLLLALVLPSAAYAQSQAAPEVPAPKPAACQAVESQLQQQAAQHTAIVKALSSELNAAIGRVVQAEAAANLLQAQASK